MSATEPVQLSGAAIPHRLVVSLWREATGAWEELPLAREGERLKGVSGDAAVTLSLQPGDGDWAWGLELEAKTPTRVQLALELPRAEAPYHILPAFIFGDNSLSRVDEPKFPHLTASRPDLPNCSPYWECRADRCSHPVSIAAFEGGVAAVSIDPYCDDASGAVASPDSLPPSILPGAATEGHTSVDFVRNGLFARLAHEGLPHACGVTLGYRNAPATYVAKRNFADPTSHLCRTGSVSGRIFLEPAPDRTVVHRVIRAIHAALHEPAEVSLSVDEGKKLLAKAMTGVGWDPAEEDWTDMKLDFDAGELKAFRPNHEIGWTGGVPCAYPLLVHGLREGNDDAVQKALTVMDRIASEETFNPRSGWLYEMRWLDRADVHGWWPHFKGEAHYAYTNGEAATYLLHGVEAIADRNDLDRSLWRTVALRVLDNALAVQKENGSFGYAYAVETGAILDDEGFAGCWFVPGMVLAHRLTGEAKYLDSARKAMAYYRVFVRSLECYGCPMDTFKAVDQEGILSFIRGARLLHEVTGEDDALRMLAEGAEFEYLWRFAFRTRPEVPPLKDSSWSAVGGSITSTSNPHIHPMGLLVAGDLAYLAAETGDDYHRRRMEDGRNFTLNAIALYPGETGYGEPGVLTERFCPSDGLLSERYPDGSPASVWFSYHVWGAANALEGLLFGEDAAH
jgi:hypothetical protein